MDRSEWSILFYLYNSKNFLYSKIPNKTQSDARCCGILFLINKTSLKKTFVSGLFTLVPALC